MDIMKEDKTIGTYIYNTYIHLEDFIEEMLERVDNPKDEYTAIEFFGINDRVEELEELIKSLIKISNITDYIIEKNNCVMKVIITGSLLSILSIFSLINYNRNTCNTLYSCLNIDSDLVNNLLHGHDMDISFGDSLVLNYVRKINLIQDNRRVYEELRRLDTPRLLKYLSKMVEEIYGISLEELKKFDNSTDAFELSNVSDELIERIIKYVRSKGDRDIDV